MQFKTMQTLLLVSALLAAVAWTATAQPGAPSQSDPERKAQRLTAELFLAINRGDPKGVSAVLARGADPNGRNWLGLTALMWAANRGNAQIVDLLLKNHGQLEAQSIYGTTLGFALTGRREALALHLLDRGASTHIHRADSASALMLASANGETSVIRLLLAKRDDPNATDADGATPLIYAARIGQTEAAGILLQAGAHINAQDSHGDTALMYAAKAGQPAVLDLLLAHKAEVNRTDRAGASALLLAARYSGSAPIVRSLLKAGANADLKDGHGATALTLAEARGYDEAAQALREGGATAVETNRAAFKEASRPAVERSLALIQTGMKTFAGRVQCGSCHHQGLGMMALGTAQQHGFPVDRELVGNYLKHAGEDGQRMGPLIHQALTDLNVARTVPAVDIQDFAIGAGYMFSGLVAQGIPSNPGLQELAQFLAMQQSAEGYWGYGMERGPMQSSYLTSTALTLQVLHAYGSHEGQGSVVDAITRARQWLSTVATPHTEDKSSRLLGLKWAGASQEERARSVQELLAAQRKDGGWAQQPSLGSDAYATGMALYALHVGGELSTDDPAYQRGVQFLLRTQDEDGSWYVNKLTSPV